MSSKNIVSLVFALSLVAFAAARADDLQIYTGDSGGQTASGVNSNAEPFAVVELVEEMRSRVGGAGPIHFVPWANAYHTALHQPDVMIFPTVRTEQRESLFQWAGPLRNFHYHFFGLAGRGPHIGSLDDAKALPSIGVVRDSFLDAELTRRGFTNLDRSKNEVLVIHKLVAGRTTAIVEGEESLRRYFLDNGGDRKSVVVLGDFMESSSFLAFSLGTAPETVRRWQQALDAMKKEGSFDRLYGNKFEN